MIFRSFSMAASALAMAGLVTADLAASDPAGIYCIVQKVVMTPDEQRPAAVQLWGACALATAGRNDDGTWSPGWYTEPRAGYLYYSAPAGQAALAIREWADLKRVAGTGEIVTFGGRYMRLGRLRWADEKPAGPDPYPIHLGVTRMPVPPFRDYPGMSYTALFASLKKAAGIK